MLMMLVFGAEWNGVGAAAAHDAGVWWGMAMG